MTFVDPEVYQKLARYYALRLETKTGLRHSRGSVMNIIKESYGIQGGTKKKVLANYELYLKEQGLM